MIVLNYDMCNQSGKLSTTYLHFMRKIVDLQGRNNKVFRDKTLSLDDLEGKKEDRSDLYIYDLNRGSRFHQLGFKMGVGGVDLGRVLAIGKGKALDYDYFIMYVDNRIFYDYSFINPLSIYDYIGVRDIELEPEIEEGRELVFKKYPKIVRLDVALDGFESAEKAISYTKKVMADVQEKRNIEREAFRKLRSYHFKEDKIETITYYWGTTASKREICVYDKKAHPEVKQYIEDCLKRVGGQVGWRVEFRFMDIEPDVYDIWNKCILDNIYEEYTDLRGNEDISDYMSGSSKPLNLEKWKRDYISAMAYLKCWGIDSRGVRRLMSIEIDKKVKKLRQRYGKEGLHFGLEEFEVALDKL